MHVSYNRDENRISVKGGNPIKSNQKTSEMNLWGQIWHFLIVIINMNMY